MIPFIHEGARGTLARQHPAGAIALAMTTCGSSRQRRHRGRMRPRFPFGQPLTLRDLLLSITSAVLVSDHNIHAHYALRVRAMMAYDPSGDIAGKGIQVNE